MADRIELRQVTVPPQTTQAAPFRQDVSFIGGEVVEIEIVIPDGHAGITGLAVAQSQQIVIPFDGTTWIISNDEVIHWPWSDKLKNGSWQCFAYNQDFVNPHTFYLRFLVNETAPAAGSVPQAVSASAILQAAPATVTPTSGTPAPAVSSPAGRGVAATVAGAPGEVQGASGGPPVSAALAAAQAELGPIGGSAEEQALASLEADQTLASRAPAGLQAKAPNLEGVRFSVAPPGFSSESP